MSELLLDSLQIKGYRCFEHLTVEKLGRVNLIVGKNNVGKTALLEALWIYTQRGKAQVIFDLLETRDESVSDLKLQSTSNVLEPRLFTIQQMFTNRPFVKTQKSAHYITIGDANDGSKKILIGICWLDYDKANDRKIIDNRSDNFTAEPYLTCFVDYVNGSSKPELIEGFSLTDMKSLSLIEKRRAESHSFSSLFIRTSGLTNDDVSTLWDAISITELEEEVIKSVQIILPSIQKIGFVGNPQGSLNRIPKARLQGSLEPVSLRSYGEGTNRLLGIALALVNCKDGVLLIDEIENGLHYSVLPDVWKLIFRTAKDLNVQVFATTHSKDCIEAFAQAADESLEDGVLIRLERQGEKIVAKTIEEERLVDAVEYDVEVR